MAYEHLVLGNCQAFTGRRLHDNLRVHKAPGLAELVEKHGARLLFLPPYSPAFTPVELTFSKLETFLRTAQVRTREPLMAAVRRPGLD